MLDNTVVRQVGTKTGQSKLAHATKAHWNHYQKNPDKNNPLFAVLDNTVVRQVGTKTGQSKMAHAIVVPQNHHWKKKEDKYKTKQTKQIKKPIVCSRLCFNLQSSQI